MISRTLARNRHVTEAIEARNTSFSHSICSMSSESDQWKVVPGQNGRNGLSPRRAPAVALAEHQTLQRATVMHDSVTSKDRIDHPGASHDAGGAEAGIKDREVRQTVEQRDNSGVWPYGPCNRLDG